jgi:hypothetical protein
LIRLRKKSEILFKISSGYKNPIELKEAQVAIKGNPATRDLWRAIWIKLIVPKAIEKIRMAILFKALHVSFTVD